MAPAKVHALIDALAAAGAGTLVIADTIGAAGPKAVGELMAQAVDRHGSARIAAHLHDTRGLAVANAWAALEAGVRQFDSSVGGLGGCPFAPGAAGNLATEDLVLLAQQTGFETGVTLDALLDVVTLATQLTQRELGGRSYAWLQKRRA